MERERVPLYPKDAVMRFTMFLGMTCMVLVGRLGAQAPSEWVRTGERKTTEIKGAKYLQYGEWRNEDGSRTAMLVNMGQVESEKDFATKSISAMSGVMRSGILPLKFESRAKPFPVLILRGQAEHEGAEYFQDTYAIFTKSSLLMLKVSSVEKGVPLDLERWALGEPRKDDDRAYAEELNKITKVLNDKLPEFREIVKNVRESRKKSSNSQQ